MTDDQTRPVVDDDAAAPDAPETSSRVDEEAVAVEDMIPEPELPADAPESEQPSVVEPAPEASDAPDASEPELPAAPEPEAPAAAGSDAPDAGAAPESSAETADAVTEPEVSTEVDDVAALTAADIPALEGCDVEKSWSGDETCEGTEDIAETAEQAEALAAVDPEADSGLEPAEGEVEAAEAVAAAEAGVSVTPTWPFIAYLVAWALLCLAAGYLLLNIPAGQPIALTETYRMAVLGGVAMTIAGPLLILAVWLASYFRAGDSAKTGMLASALLKGSVVTFLGVVMWWGTFLIVDQVRFGRFI